MMVQLIQVYFQLCLLGPSHQPKSQYTGHLNQPHNRGQMAVKAKIYTWKIPSLLVQITEITWCSSSRIQHQSHSTSGKNTSKSPPKAVLTPSILSPHVWTGSKELPIQTKTTVQVLTDKKELQAIQVKSVQDEEHKGYKSTSFFFLQLPWAEVQITG